MKINKLIAGALSVLIAGGALPLTSANAQDLPLDQPVGALSAEQIEGSPIQPHFSASKILLSAEEAASSPTQTITVSVDAGLEGVPYYSTADIFVGVDKRLQIGLDQIGNYEVKAGSAWKDRFTMTTSLAGTIPDMVALSVIAISSGDVLTDGDMFSFKVTLPDDAKPGDVFPIDIHYGSTGSSTSRFCKLKSKTDESLLMEAYAFTRGLNSAYNPTDDQILLDAGHPEAEGYIAIEGSGEEFTTVTEGDLTFGDVTDDGKIDLNDAVAILQYSALPKKYPLSENALLAADVLDNGTSGITGKDALVIMMIDAGLVKPDKLPLTSADI